MDDNIKLKEIIIREKREIEWIMATKNVVNRERDIARVIETALVKVVIGPRRAGKSFFSIQSIKAKKFPKFPKF